MSSGGKPPRRPLGPCAGSARHAVVRQRPSAMRGCVRALLIAGCVVAAAASTVRGSDGHPDAPAAAAAADGATRLYLAVPLDLEGNLADALPLYRTQAEATLTKADRLRYAGALLRAGHADDAVVIYEQVSREAGSVEHGGGGAARGPAVCASSLLASGFPALALPYARQAHRLRADEPALGLLLVRALAASGDAAEARRALEDVARDRHDWVIGQRIELARWQLLTEHEDAARRLLDGQVSESIGQMFRDSILANVPFRNGDWKGAAEMLAASERKAPSGLSDKRVDRAWRNTQRELWSVQLRRAISLWNDGNRTLAAREAASAQHSDEEYVRSAASLLLVAADLMDGRRSEARVRLQAVKGHDVRFAEALDALEARPATDKDVQTVARRLEATLGQLDRSWDFVARALSQIVTEAARAGVPPPAAGREEELRPVRGNAHEAGRSRCVRLRS